MLQGIVGSVPYASLIFLTLYFQARCSALLLCGSFFLLGCCSFEAHCLLVCHAVLAMLVQLADWHSKRGPTPPRSPPRCLPLPCAPCSSWA